ncbi:MAG: hypothetical protein HQL64_09205 [Magnetococcales bacterium]|nr:hypothetical protein [Magnetococcales bacterium]
MNLEKQTDSDPGACFPLPHVTRQPFHPEVLQGLLTGVTGVEPLLDLFTDWLAPLMDVRIVAFWNSHTCEHYISCPECTKKEDPLLSLVREIMYGASPRVLHWKQLGHHFHIWTGNPLDRWDRLMIAERDSTTSVEEANAIMRQALDVLMPSLQAVRVSGKSSLRSN